MIRIATYQYKLEELDWNSYTKKINSLVLNAKQKGVQLMMLPEYAGTEIGGRHDNDKDLFVTIQALLSQYLGFYQQLSNQHNLFIQPGSIPVEISAGKYVNRAYFFGPDTPCGYQDKLQLVEFEKNTGIILHGQNQTLFDTVMGKIGIAICYDSEFPEIVRSLVNAGAQLILVPSYTNTLASYHRVASSCRARAIENQCYVAVSYVVGSASWGSVIPENTTGQAAIFSPADDGFPDNGIIAQGTMDEIEVVIADIFPEKILRVREQGQVRNFADSMRLNANKAIAIKVRSL